MIDTEQSALRAQSAPRRFDPDEFLDVEQMLPGDVVAYEDYDVELTDEMLHAMNLFLAGRSIYLTGRAGTGKSTLVRLLRRIAEQRDTSHAVTASTGIAAFNVGGQTLHRMFGLDWDLPPLAEIGRRAWNEVQAVQSNLTKANRGAAARVNSRVKTLGQLQTLFVDEVSMVRADVLDAVVEVLRFQGPQPYRHGEQTHPSGGVQLVLVGDLYQLPPVLTRSDEKSFLERGYSKPFKHFFGGGHYRHLGVQIVELTRVFRQKDARLVDVLNAVREGRRDEPTMQALSGFVREGFEPDPDQKWLILSSLNKKVDQINAERLEELKAVNEWYVYEPEVHGEIDTAVRRYTSLELAVGAQVMMTKNNYAGGWVNGTLGTVVSLPSPDDVRPWGSEQWAKWYEGEDPGGAIGVLAKDEDGCDTVLRVPRLERELYEHVPGKDGKVKRKVVGAVQYFPLRLAWALTVHKAQGQTADRVLLDLSGGMFEPGMLYTALTRVTGPDGLVLSQVPRHTDIQVDPAVQWFMGQGG